MNKGLVASNRILSLQVLESHHSTQFYVLLLAQIFLAIFESIAAKEDNMKHSQNMKH